MSQVKEQSNKLASKADESPRICSKVRPRSGSRIARVKCRTIAQIKRDNEINKDKFTGARRRHNADPYNVGVWKP
ncbi:MAG: hypothetical protein AAF438_07870 [Pseudomonadota bacterium]